ncbi:MAG: serine/threonine-protein phosphatase [Ruminococcaceae bacterium]|nr:serine/threonine-protein phosphatase [Oscillospiraceae bacterium]
MTFYISGTTDIGIKKSINQDSFLIKKIKTSIGPVVFACICDGMGGLENGELASATVLHSFNDWINNTLPYLTTSPICKEKIFKQWEKIIKEDNNKIRQYGKLNNDIHLGTTLTAMLVTKKNYYIANIGDTRAYEISNKLTQLTKDHSLVQRQIDEKIITPEQAKTAKNQNVLTQCIGVNENVNPDFYFGKIRKNTTFMLCSDGFRHKLDECELELNFKSKQFKSQSDIKRKEELLIGYNKERGETDNITVTTIVVK